MNNIKLDERISDLVRRVAPEAPEDLEDRALGAARASSKRPTAARRRAFGLRLWPAMIPVAVLAFAAVLLVLPALRRPSAAPIAEIRTEFELADKNIKVIFFQKPDFNLFKEN
jgi:hypothetical protein